MQRAGERANPDMLHLLSQAVRRNNGEHAEGDGFDDVERLHDGLRVVGVLRYALNGFELKFPARLGI